MRQQLRWYRIRCTIRMHRPYMSASIFMILLGFLFTHLCRVRVCIVSLRFIQACGLSQVLTQQAFFAVAGLPEDHKSICNLYTNSSL